MQRGPYLGKDYRKRRKAKRPATKPTPTPLLLAQLVAAGWEVETIDPADKPHIIRGDRRQVQLIDQPSVSSTNEKDTDWFGLELGVMIDGTSIDVLPALRLFIADAGWQELLQGRDTTLVPLPDGRILQAPAEPLRRMLGHLEALFARKEPLLNRFDEDLLASAEAMGAGVRGGEKLRERCTELRRLGAGEYALPPTLGLFHGSLRPYQQEGVAWLQAIMAAEVQGLLADDMGLGKTVQTIAHCCAAIEGGLVDATSGDICIIAPRSLLGVWQAEFARFAPDIVVWLYHGSGRVLPEVFAQTNDGPQTAAPRVIVTTYATVQRDAKELSQRPFSLIVCDEAQALKNSSSKTYRALSTLQGRYRLALSGTPVENNLGELWSLMHWLNPGLLGPKPLFDRIARKAIEQERDHVAAQRLRSRLAPVVLRRTKDVVAKDLPPKTESTITVRLGEKQRALYESIRAAMDAEVRSTIAARGLAKKWARCFRSLVALAPSMLPSGSYSYG